MSILRHVVAVLVVLATPAILHAQVDAPTGTYKGTIVHERRLTWKQVDPPRVVSYKQKTKVTGFGYVPQGGTRTLIRLIVPPRAFRDEGLDVQIEVDFTPSPPVITILSGLGTLPFPFPTITVDGTTVTVTTFVGVNTSDYEIADIRTLTIKRSKS
jgi:hypothetical protein